MFRHWGFLVLYFTLICFLINFCFFFKKMAMWFHVYFLYFFCLFDISSCCDSCAKCFLLVLGFWWVQKIFEGRGWKIWPRVTNSPFITWFCWYKLSLSSELCADKSLDVKVCAWCFMKYFDQCYDWCSYRLDHHIIVLP